MQGHLPVPPNLNECNRAGSRHPWSCQPASKPRPSCSITDDSRSTVPCERHAAQVASLQRGLQMSCPRTLPEFPFHLAIVGTATRPADVLPTNGPTSEHSRLRPCCPVQPHRRKLWPYRKETVIHHQANCSSGRKLYFIIRCLCFHENSQLSSHS